METANREFDMSNSKFSYNDIEDAVDYGFSSVSVSASEVGTQIYGELVHEKMVEFLSRKFDE